MDAREIMCLSIALVLVVGSITSYMMIYVDKVKGSNSGYQGPMLALPPALSTTRQIPTWPTQTPDSPQDFSGTQPEVGITTMGNQDVGCPSGYTEYGAVCFKAYNQRKTYNQARQVCADDGGLLAMPKNNELNDFLWYLKNATDGSAYYWIGLNDQKSEGEWMWEDGTPYNISHDWNYWYYGQPDNHGGGEDCAHYHVHASWGWNDEPCDRTYKFICMQVQDCVGKPDGSDYRGNISVTLSGKTCQRWAYQLCYKPDVYPELAENYCRNPGRDEPTIWCYTTDPSTRWEHCINPQCH